MPIANLPFLQTPLRDFPAAPILLQEGNRSYGKEHIAHFHHKELNGQSVEAFVASIVKPGTPIYCEFDSMGKDQKILAVSSRNGTAVLVFKRTRRGDFYTVITAFARRQPKGELIGHLV